MHQNGIYIDDDPGAQTFASRLESDRLKIDLHQPGELISLADRIVDQSPAVVVLDYRLDQFKGNRAEAVTYRAGPMAQHMRDRTGVHPNQDFPIVLISSEEKIRDLYRPEKTAHDLFDWKLVKTDVSRSKNAATILLGLVDGYSLLRQHAGDYFALHIFDLQFDQMYLVDYQELREILGDAKSPHIAARYILNFVFRRQGILLNRENLRARFGIEEPVGFSKDALDQWLEPTRYRGAFAGCGERWWSSLIDDLLADAFGGPVAEFTAAQRAEKLSARLGHAYAPARNRWDQSTAYMPIFACASCQSPTPLKHSLACLDGLLPSFVQRRRVCYTCVQTDEYIERRPSLDEDMELRLDSGEKRVAERIRTGQVTQRTT